MNQNTQTRFVAAHTAGTKGKKLTANQLMILHKLSLKPSTVFNMSRNEVAIITGLTQMGIHYACRALEKEGLLESNPSKGRTGKPIQIKIVSDEGDKRLELEAESTEVNIPVSVVDLYLIENLYSKAVQEVITSQMVRQRSKATCETLKAWLTYAINRLQSL